MLGDHLAGTQDGGAVAGHGNADAQVRGGQRQGAPVHHFPDASHEVFARFSHAAADDDHGGVEQVNHGCQHIADIASRLPQRLNGLQISFAHQPQDVRTGGSFQPLGLQLARDGGT